jgi:UDP-2,3-diacylglucosamine pyrophosphatase LpxH
MTKYRAIFISDVHLGTRGCRAPLLADFLRRHDCDVLYLVGDIFDGWQIQRGWHWPDAHNEVVQCILGKAQKGTRVVFIPGNHDEVMRRFPGIHFGGIEVKDDDTFVTANGKRYLVTHGDQFDTVIANARWLAYLGDRVYATLIWLNPKINMLRRLWSRKYWSLSKWSKHQVKQAVNFIGKYEEVLSADARQRGFDGVICGHIHHAAIRQIGDIHYVNTGDWVESCTAIVEDMNGELRLIDWEARSNRLRLLEKRQTRRKRAPRMQNPSNSTSEREQA